jgi:ribonuclease-3
MTGIQTAPYKDFAKDKLGFEFKNIDTIITAFTHRSYVNEHRKSTHDHNERLEFLGDAVLELVVTDFLFSNFNEPEGILTSWRAALVRTESIGAAGIALEYEPLIRMSRGEKRGSDRAKKQILANAFEALTGAIYLEAGYDQAEKFIHQNIISRFDRIIKSGEWRDAKSHLQEVSQRVDGETPQYKVLAESGPDHDKTFKLGVYVKGRLMGSGVGPNKQTAQQLAAKQALEKYEKQGKV